MTCVDDRLFALWVTITLLGKVRAHPDMAGVANILSETEAVLFDVLRTLGQTDKQEKLVRSAPEGHTTAH